MSLRAEGGGPRLTVDLRMYRHSGIGRYLRNVFPAMLSRLAAEKVRVLGERAVIGDAGWLGDPRIELVETAAPVYSPAEQMPGMRGRMLVTIHDLAPLAIPEALSNVVKRGYARLLRRRATHRAREIRNLGNLSRAG